MNTATRVMSATDLAARKRTKFFAMGKQGIWVAALLIALLFSAFGIVYIKDLNRRLFIQYQELQHEKSQQLVQWGRLLLEQSTWSTQSRIQQVAERQLGMQTPNAKRIVLVQGSDVHETLR